jgi:5-methylcytosine-specific restriction protein A
MPDRLGPRTAPKPCIVHRCPELIRDGTRCAKHATHNARTYDKARGTSSSRGYGARHREWRESVLARDRDCRACEKKGHPSDIADHVVPIKQGGPRFALSNGQRLCVGCHNRKTARDGSR